MQLMNYLTLLIDNIIVSETEVLQALINMDPSKASGLDDIGPRILVSCASALCKPLHHLFNNIIEIWSGAKTMEDTQDNSSIQIR